MGGVVAKIPPNFVHVVSTRPLQNMKITNKVGYFKIKIIKITKNSYNIFSLSAGKCRTCSTVHSQFDESSRFYPYLELSWKIW